MLTRKQYELLTFIENHLRETGFSPSFEEMKDALQLRSKSGIHRLISALEERGFLRRRHHRARALEVVRLPDDAAARAPQQMDLVPHSTPYHGTPDHGTPDHGAPPHATTLHASPPRPDRTDGPRPVALRPPLPFSPNVIQGGFSGRLPGVRAASEAGAVQLPLYGRIAAGLPIEALRDTTSQIEVPLALLGNGEHYALIVAGDSMIDAGILDGDTVIIRREETAESGQIIVALVDETEVTLKRLRRRGQSIALEPANPRHEIRIFPADRVKVQGRLVALLRQY